MSSSYIVFDSLESARFLFIPSWSSRICLSRSRWYVWEKLWWNISNDSEMSCFMILHLQVPEISDIVEKVDGLTSLSVSLWIAQLASQRVSYSVSLSASQSFIICQVNIPVIQFVTWYNVRCVSYIIIIHEFYNLSVCLSVCRNDRPNSSIPSVISLSIGLSNTEDTADLLWKKTYLYFFFYSMTYNKRPGKTNHM